MSLIWASGKWRFSLFRAAVDNCLLPNWDEKSNTLTYETKGPGDGTILSTMHFLDQDNRVGTRVARDAEDKLFQDVRFKLTRQK
jgi:hypothetical protein